MVVVAQERLSTTEQVAGAGIAGYLDFDVAVAVADSAATVRVKGELDCYTAPRLRSALRDLAEEGVRQVTVDVGGVEFIDSTGLSVLVGGMKRLRERGGRMVVKSPNDATRKLFEITGLQAVIEVT